MRNSKSQTSRPSTLSYLHKGLVFVGSTFGDSELIKLQSEKDPETGEYIQHLESFTNLGPIVDFCVVDMDRQGQVCLQFSKFLISQGQIVTCSGAYKDGSLRVVTNGIGINEHAQLELPGIKGIWYLQPPAGSNSEKYLVMSFVGEVTLTLFGLTLQTRVLSMSGEDLEEVEIEGLQLNQQTIYCCNVEDQQYVQVTTKGVYLLNAQTEKLLDSWTPVNNESITICSSNTTQVILATGGTNLVLLEVANSKLNVVGLVITHATAIDHFRTKKMPHEISCLNINPVGVSGPKAQMCAVGFWTDISVKVLALPKFEEIRSIPIEGEVIPRSVLFYTFDDVTYLFIALGDGHLISFVYDLV